MYVFTKNNLRKQMDDNRKQNVEIRMRDFQFFCVETI